MIIAMIKAFTGVRWDIPFVGPMARKQTGETLCRQPCRPLLCGTSGAARQSLGYDQQASSFTTISVRTSS